MTKSNHLPITQWAEDDRPREKLLNKGIIALSNAELIGILIRSGNREESAVELSKRILQEVDNNLDKLAKSTVNHLCTFKGIGEAKAISIITALEIGRRRSKFNGRRAKKISCSKNIYDEISPVLSDLCQEEFWVIFLNRQLEVIKKEQISRGGISQTQVDVRIIIKKTLEYSASAIALCHNHPSGNKKPSNADRTLTKRIIEIAKHFQIEVIDHIIVGNKEYFSFADEEILVDGINL